MITEAVLYPNPFTNSAVINYNLDKPAYVIIRILDMTGHEYSVPVNEYLTSGRKQVIIDGSIMPQGLYNYSIQFNGKIQTDKMMLVK